MLVNARYIKHVLDSEYGRKATPEEVRVVVRALEREVPQYYTHHERERLHHYSKFWRIEDADPFVRTFARVQMQTWRDRGVKHKLPRADA